MTDGNFRINIYKKPLFISNLKEFWNNHKVKVPRKRNITFSFLNHLRVSHWPYVPTTSNTSGPKVWGYFQKTSIFSSISQLMHQNQETNWHISSTDPYSSSASCPNDIRQQRVQSLTLHLSCQLCPGGAFRASRPCDNGIDEDERPLCCCVLLSLSVWCPHD